MEETKDKKLYWKKQGFMMLHDVSNTREGKAALAMVPQTEMFHYLTCKDIIGLTPLRRAVMRDNISVARLIIGASEPWYRDHVIYCLDDNRQTPLHSVRSVEMAQLLLGSLSPHLVKRYIKHRDRHGHTVAHHAVSWGHDLVLLEIWERLERASSRRKLLTWQDHEGCNLIMMACMRDKKQTIAHLIEMLIEADCLDQAVSATSLGGETALGALVVHQNIEDVVDILKALTLPKRRQLLAIKNTKGYDARQLAMTPPPQVKVGGRRTQLNLFIFKTGITRVEVSSHLLSVLHLLTNEYNITAPVSIIQCRLPTSASFSHVQLHMKTAEITVSSVQAIDAVETDFIATGMLLLPSKSSRNKNDSDLTIAIPQMRRQLLYEVLWV